MTYVITEACIDELDGSCVDVCPVDCIYQGLRSRYINAVECIDCGACEPACPVEAIFLAPHVPDAQQAHVADNTSFFTTTLPGRAAPLGNPGGADACGVVGVDTPLVAGTHPGD